MSLIIYATAIGTGEILGYLYNSSNQVLIQNSRSFQLNPSLPGTIDSNYLWNTYNISSSTFYIGTSDDLRWTQRGSTFTLGTAGTAFQSMNPNFNDSQLTYLTQIYTTSLQIMDTVTYLSIQNNQLVAAAQNTVQFNFLLYIGQLVQPNYLFSPFCSNLTSNMSVTWIYTYCTPSVSGSTYMATYFPSPPTTTNNIPVYNSKLDQIPSNLCSYVSYQQDSDQCWSNFQGITIYDCNYQTQYLLTINCLQTYPQCAALDAIPAPCLSIQASVDNSYATQYVNISNQTQNYLLVQGQAPVNDVSSKFTPFQFYLYPGANTNLSLSEQVNICNAIQLQDQVGDVNTSNSTTNGQCLGFGSGEICTLQ